MENNLMDIHLRQKVSHCFSQKSRLCLGGRVRSKSQRELKDKNFCKNKENKCQDYCEKCEKTEKKKILLEKYKNKRLLEMPSWFKVTAPKMVAHP